MMRPSYLPSTGGAQVGVVLGRSHPGQRGCDPHARLSEEHLCPPEGPCTDTKEALHALLCISSDFFPLNRVSRADGYLPSSKVEGLAP